MVDQAVEVKETPVIEATNNNNLETAVVGLGKDLKKDLAERGELSLDELLKRIYVWENEHGEKLTEDEYEVFEILSLVIGTTKVVYEKKIGKSFKPKEALVTSVITQQDVVKTVLGNLEEDGKPNNALMRSFGLVTEIFEDYLDPEKGKMKDEGVYGESGYWQGIRGMVTTALMFNDAGWEVKLPPPELDVDCEVDLLAKNPEGKFFAIDVTSRWPTIMDDRGTMSEPFYVNKKPVPRNIQRNVENHLFGFVEVNVPPLGHHASQGFYENRITGYPSEKAMYKFKRDLGN